jgi:hypothetical protein
MAGQGMARQDMARQNKVALQLEYAVRSGAISLSVGRACLRALIDRRRQCLFSIAIVTDDILVSA